MCGEQGGEVVWDEKKKWRRITYNVARHHGIDMVIKAVASDFEKLFFWCKLIGGGRIARAGGMITFACVMPKGN